MGLFKNLFGHKSEPDSDSEDPSQEQESLSPSAEDVARPAQPQVAQTVELSPEEDYGLKFVYDSGESSKVFTSLPIGIGRSEENDLVLNDDTVSANHARIYYDEQVKDVCIVDVDSLNGLFIDDQPTRRNVLFDGVKIRLGNVSITFRDTGYIHSG